MLAARPMCFLRKPIRAIDLTSFGGAANQLYQAELGFVILQLASLFQTASQINQDRGEARRLHSRDNRSRYSGGPRVFCENRREQVRVERLRSGDVDGIRVHIPSTSPGFQLVRSVPRLIHGSQRYE
jgi:hypothetical protein